MTTVHAPRNGHSTFTNPLTAGGRLITDTAVRRGAGVRAAAVRVVAAVRDALLIVLGFTALTVAAFLAHPIAGWAVAGVSLLVMDYCRRGDSPRGGGSP